MACECCERKVVATDKAPKALGPYSAGIIGGDFVLRPVNWEWIR